MPKQTVGETESEETVSFKDKGDMWTFKMRHSTLQVMLMMLMVCSAPGNRVPQPNQRKMILHKINITVEKLLKEEFKNIMVVKPLSNSHNCPENFFCLAEKVMAEKAKEENAETNKDLTILTNNFKQYNKHCSTNCTLNTDHRYHLRAFLGEVQKCVKYFLYSKTHKEMNKDC